MENNNNNSNQTAKTDWLTHSIAISIALLRWRNNGQSMEKTKRELTGWLQSDWLKVSIVIFRFKKKTSDVVENRFCQFNLLLWSVIIATTSHLA